MRQLLLRSGRAYPDHARRVVERAIAFDRRSQEVFEAIVVFAPILAEVCPEQLADLVRAEVFEKLPREEMEEEQRNRERYFGRLKEIRAKPEAERSDTDRRILSSAASSTVLGTKSYDLDDLGIERHNP